MNRPISELFDQALDLPAAERERFLAALDVTNPAAGGEVRALLAASEAAGDFLPENLPPAPHVERQLTRLQAERAGERIGRYRLLEEIGEGGFGTVWLAEQLEPVTRRVALKILKLGMDTREVIARFESERQALALMEHEHIAKVYDAGATQSGRPFFVMEFVRGVPITEFCDQGQLGTRARLALFADVCSALSHAHQKGVIHRDIKPSNVLVTVPSADDGDAPGERPIVKVIDFGIAKATQGRLTDKTLATRHEMFLGTPAYMSPEQANWGGLDVDTRSDIYALGALLYELVAGRPPFDSQALAAAGYDEVRRILGEVEPPRPSARLRTTSGEERSRLAWARRTEPPELARLVEPDLDWIVMKALEKDRTRRYQTAQDLAQDLAHFLADEPVTARPPSRGYLFRKFARRHRTALRVGAGILALLLAATAVSAWLALRASQAESLAQVEAARARAQQRRADLEAERAQDQLYEAHMHLSLPTWREHRGVRAMRDLLARWQPAPGGPDRRRWEWYYLSALPERNARTLRPASPREASTGVAWHAGTGRLAEGTGEGEVRIWDVVRGQTTEVLAGPEAKVDFYGGRWLAWNPAGNLLAAAGRDGAVWLWDFATSTRDRQVWRTQGGPLRGVVFSSDGRRLLAWAEDGRITVWRCETGQIEAECTRRGAVSAAAWSPDDRTLALGHVDGSVTLAAPAPGAPVATLAAHADEIYDLAWSPDGTRLATTGANEFWVSVWDVAKQQRVLGPLRHSHGVTSLAWEPGGLRLASGSMDQAVKIWNTTSGREEVVLRGLEDRVTALAWGPQGQLAAGGGFCALKVWTSLHDQEWEALHVGRRNTAVAWSPADGRLASAGDDGLLRIWQPPNQKPQREIPAHRESAIYPETGLIRALAWSPDGRWLASVGFDGAAKIWDPETGREHYALPADRGARWSIAWSPDGQTLAVGTQSGTIQLIAGFPTHPTVREFPAHEGPIEGHGARGGVRALAWSPRGDRLASSGWDRLAKIWDPERGVELQRLAGHTRIVLSLDWSPDGRQLVTASSDTSLMLWEADSGRKVWSVQAHNDFVDAVRWSPDGQRIASAGLDNSVRLWEPRTGGQCLVLRGKFGMFHDLSWSRDGRQLAAASSDGDVWIWAAEEQR